MEAVETVRGEEEGVEARRRKPERKKGLVKDLTLGVAEIKKKRSWEG